MPVSPDSRNSQDSSNLSQPWKVWIDAEIAARQEAEASEDLKLIQEERRKHYEDVMRNYPKRHKSPDNKAG
ncbi:hypothetical protein ACLX1H_003302 [Fusarium chlamydosporum]